MKTSHHPFIALTASMVVAACGTPNERETPAPLEVPSVTQEPSGTTQEIPHATPTTLSTPVASSAENPTLSIIDVMSATPSAPLANVIPATRAAAIGRSTSHLASALYARLSGTPGNLVFSPASVHGALAMVTLGARAQTARELERVLGVRANATEQLRDEGALQRSWNAPRAGRVFHFVNRLYGEATMRFEEPYLATLRESFGAPLAPVDFQHHAEDARIHINDWVATVTEQRIHDLLPPLSVDATTSLVLVNAVYLNTPWETAFSPSLTTTQPFTPTEGDPRSVPMMHRAGTMRMATIGDAQVIELPYQDENLAMRFILPPRGREDAWVTEAHLNANTFEALEVDLFLPRFHLEPEGSVSLRDAIQALGARAAFEPQSADLSGIASLPHAGERLFLSDVFHQAFIHVDESGTEAAAATGASAVRGRGPHAAPRRIVVRFDRPFLFQLIDVTSGATLFLGRVAQPS